MVCSGLFQAGQRSPALLPGQHQPWQEPGNLPLLLNTRLPQAAPPSSGYLLLPVIAPPSSRKDVAARPLVKTVTIKTTSLPPFALPFSSPPHHRPTLCQAENLVGRQCAMVEASLGSWLGRQWLELVSVCSAERKPRGRLFKFESGECEAMVRCQRRCHHFPGTGQLYEWPGPNHHVLAARQRRLTYNVQVQMYTKSLQNDMKFPLEQVPGIKQAGAKHREWR